MIATGMIECAVMGKTKLGTEAMGKVNVSIKTTVISIKLDRKTWAAPTHMVGG